MKQTTIATEITARASKTSHMQGRMCTLKPSVENHGISIQRIDLPEKPIFFLGVDSVLEMLPSLETEWLDLKSYLPLLAVIRALGIDNVLIESNDKCFPDFGNTASAILFLVKSAGIREQNALKKSLELSSPLMVSASDKSWVRLMPSERNRMAIICSEPTAGQKIGFRNEIADVTLAFFTSELCHTRCSESLEEQLAVEASAAQNPQMRGRLSREKTLRAMFEAYAVLALLPWNINADFIAFNSTHESNIAILQKVLSELKQNNIKVTSHNPMTMQPEVAVVS